MGNENVKSVALFNRNFKVVEVGLDESEVTAFIKELLDEREQLLKRQENLASLTRLYEKTVIDAGDLAKQIEKEARENVQKEAGTILTKADERAKLMAEQQKAEAIAIIQQQTKSINNTLRKQLETSLKAEKEKLQSIIREAAKQVSESMVSQANQLNFQNNNFEINLDSGVSRGEPAVETEEPVKKMQANGGAKPQAEIVTVSSKKEKDIIEVEITLPRDHDEIASIVHALVTTPQVDNVDLQTMVDKSVLNVALQKHIDVLALLQTLPEVHKAEWIVNNGHKRIAVDLAVKARLEAQHNELGSKVMDIFYNKSL